MEELEKQLQAIEQIESYGKDEQANLVASVIAKMVVEIPRDQLVSFFKSMILRNPDIMDYWVDFLKTKVLKQYRDAIKMARRKPTITRK